MNSLKQTIEAAWENRTLLKEKETQAAIRSIIAVSYTHLTLPTILLV